MTVISTYGDNNGLHLHLAAHSRNCIAVCCARTQDHVVSPFEGVPADGAGCHVAGSNCEEHFDFRRLGPRGSALLISPWVEKGAVFQVQKHTHAPSTCVSDWISHSTVVLELLCVTRSSGRF
eukprot:COSAG02_NODE_772_length_17359_cov_74.661587_3_plen_122_part_00